MHGTFHIKHPSPPPPSPDLKKGHGQSFPHLRFPVARGKFNSGRHSWERFVGYSNSTGDGTTGLSEQLFPQSIQHWSTASHVQRLIKKELDLSL